MAAPLQVLSLCSGIGGLDLGVGRVIRSRVVAYVERDPYAASVLMARMEEQALDPAPLWVGDLRDLDARTLAGYVDLVTAGIPCQPWSLAGKQGGERDERHLGGELLRIVREVRASYVFVENVPGFQGALQVLAQELATLGMDAVWGRVRAEDVGASHRRERIFLLAHANGRGLQSKRGSRVLHSERETLGHDPDGRGRSFPCSDWAGIGELLDHWATEPDVGRVAHGVPARVDRLRCLGNAAVPQQAAAAFSVLWEQLHG